jgi:hypothetical protein
MTEDKKQQNLAPGNASDHPERDRIRLLLVDDETAYVDVLANRLGKTGV